MRQLASAFDSGIGSGIGLDGFSQLGRYTV